jgi:hydrogenase/urease accessory protein HupE
VPALDLDHDRTVSADELERGHDPLRAALVAGLQVGAAASPCPGELSRAYFTEQDGLAVSLVFHCARADAYQVRLRLLASMSVGHRHLAAVKNAVGAETHVLYEANPGFTLAANSGAASSSEVASSLFKLGIEHILTGYDHLLFLFGLILVGGSMRSLLLVVTAFTLAHSITLGIATLGVWVPSPSVVEPAIALSISYVGVENWFVRDASRRWLLTFPFGLVHGFGFAGALREIALPSTQIPVALVSFNAGVEAGQVAVLALVLPTLIWLRRRAWFAGRGVQVLSGGIALAGMAWFVQRIS